MSPGFFAQHLDAFITQQIERGEMDRLDFVLAELGNRRVGVLYSRARSRPAAARAGTHCDAVVCDFVP